MPLFARIVIDGPLPVGERVALLMDGWAGLCGNPREILAGPSGARDARLFAIADSVGSRHARDLLLLARRRWAEPALEFRLLWCTIGDYAAR